MAHTMVVLGLVGLVWVDFVTSHHQIPLYPCLLSQVVFRYMGGGINMYRSIF